MNSFMTSLYDLRETLRTFYAKRGAIVLFIFKFVSVFLMQLSINSMTGYFTKLTMMPVVLVLSLILSILPWWMITCFMCLLILLHLLKVSLLITGVAFCIFLLMLLVNLIFAPGNSLVIFFVPLAFYLKIPFLVPIVVGLLAPLTAAVPMSFGVMIYYLLSYVNGSAGILANAANTKEEIAVTMINQLMSIINNLISNYEMYTVIAAFAVTAVVVYLLHKLSLGYAWLMAVGAGAAIDLVLFLFARASLLDQTSASMTVGFVVMSSVASFLIAMVLQFLLFAADYRHAESVQFEDDEYYYYVKAVPKVRMTEKKNDKKNIEASDEG